MLNHLGRWLEMQNSFGRIFCKTCEGTPNKMLRCTGELCSWKV